MGPRWDALFFRGFVFLASVLSAIPLRAQDAEVTKSGAVAGESTAPQISEKPSTTKREQAAEIERLIKQLGDDRFTEREKAENRLTEFGGAARIALEKALENSDREIVSRAERILSRLPKLTHSVLDAFGEPIPEADVTITLAMQSDVSMKVVEKLQVETDELGRIAIPMPEVPRPPMPQKLPPYAREHLTTLVEVMHPDYGSGRIEFSRHSSDSGLRFPLVRSGTEARKRALEGVVQDSDGKPIAGAALECRSVRTPGEGLVTPSFPQGVVVSDGSGHFVLYPANQDRRGERGELIPPNSNYQLRVTVPRDQTFFPTEGIYSNLKLCTIEMRRGTKFHTFRFAKADGGWIDDPLVLPYLSVTYEGGANGKEKIPLDRRAAFQGAWLVPGRYRADNHSLGRNAVYERIEVTADSPPELQFQLPAAVLFRGQVVHGVSGEPMAGALVMGYSAISRNNLALLSKEAWQELRTMETHTKLGPQEEHPLSPHYGVLALARTDETGQFELVQNPDQRFYGLIAFAEDFVPFSVNITSLERDKPGPVDAGKFPLFPAAKVLVRPVHDGERISVRPMWMIEKSDQPEWIEQFRSARKSYQRDYVYEHWLQLNESQPLYVPAGVRLRLKFDTPYDKFTSVVIKTPIQLDAGQTYDLGDIHFSLALPAVVRVMDSQGKPVEGVPVRRHSGNVWNVAHNTDAKGEAHFYVQPNSKGRFAVIESDFPVRQKATKGKNLTIKYAVADTAPEKPYEITLTDEQKDLLFKTAKQGM